MYVGQEATVRTLCGTTDQFKIGKGVHQGCTQTSFHNSSGTLSIRPNPLYLSLPLYNPKGFDLGQTRVV